MAAGEDAPAGRPGLLGSLAAGYRVRVQRLSTTVIALVGSDADGAAATLTDHANVRILPRTGDPVATWREVVRTRSPFCVITDDPMGEVATAWMELFERREASGRLEVAVAQLREQVRAGSLDLPDVYVALDGATFHLTALQPQAPSRVVPAAGDLPRTLSHLRSGRWWPPLEALTNDLDHRLPEAFATPEADPSPQLLR